MRNTHSTVQGPYRMKVKIWANHEAMSRAAASCIAREFGRHPRQLVCLATGSTPARTYELLGCRARKSPALFDHLRVLKLDEWSGLPMSDPGSSETYLQQRVIRPWGVSQRRFVGFVTDPRRPKLECKRIQNWLARNGPIDLCVLGLGSNGHLGFNEPDNTLCPVAHRALLSEQTRAHPMLCHTTVKPDYGLTLGMAEILQARQILVLVSGAHKRKPLKRLLRGEISTQFPASLLCLHPQTMVLCDRDAAVQEPAQVKSMPQNKANPKHATTHYLCNSPFALELSDPNSYPPFMRTL
jgi:galactosamine-6-phosphate isomerase